MKKRLITHPQTQETLTLTQWANKLGLNIGCLSARLKKHPLEIALSPYYLNSRGKPIIQQTILQTKTVLEEKRKHYYKCNLILANILLEEGLGLANIVARQQGQQVIVFINLVFCCQYLSIKWHKIYSLKEWNLNLLDEIKKWLYYLLKNQNF